jgi:hypothetical protein
VVEYVGDVEMRIVVAKLLAAAANAVLVAQHLLNLGAHLTTALPRLQVHNLSRTSSLEVGSTREKRARRSGKMLETPRGNMAREQGNAGGARACFPNGKVKLLLRSLEL